MVFDGTALLRVTIIKTTRPMSKAAPPIIYGIFDFCIFDQNFRIFFKNSNFSLNFLKLLISKTFWIFSGLYLDLHNFFFLFLFLLISLFFFHNSFITFSSFFFPALNSFDIIELWRNILYRARFYCFIAPKMECVFWGENQDFFTVSRHCPLF